MSEAKLTLRVQEANEMSKGLDAMAHELGQAMSMLNAMQRLEHNWPRQGMTGALAILGDQAKEHVQRAISEAIDARDVDIPF